MGSELTMKVARVAHECWCKHLVEEGWRPGDRIDEDAMTHNALRPFDELAPFDQEDLVMLAEQEEYERSFVTSISDMFMRSKERELSAADMRVGLLVRMADTGDRSGKVEHGRVLSWDLDNPQSGRLNTIRVEWEGGETVDHVAYERGLAIVD